MFIKNVFAMKQFGEQMKRFEEMLSHHNTEYYEILDNLYNLLMKHVFRLDMVDIAKDIRQLAYQVGKARLGDASREDVYASVKELIATIEAIEE